MHFTLTVTESEIHEAVRNLIKEQYPHQITTEWHLKFFDANNNEIRVMRATTGASLSPWPQPQPQQNPQTEEQSADPEINGPSGLESIRQRVT